jgi:hypothetical protein
VLKHFCITGKFGECSQISNFEVLIAKVMYHFKTIVTITVTKRWSYMSLFNQQSMEP